MSVTAKVLISAEEYEKLQSIAEKYEQLLKQTKEGNSLKLLYFN